LNLRSPGPYDGGFPYPNGQISDATEASFTGLDVGDATNGVALAVLWGQTSFDIMTYCNQPDWPSAYTYVAIRQRLLDENPGFRTLGRIRRRAASFAQLVGPLVHVVARLNLTKHTGSIDYVTPVLRAVPSVGPTGHAEFVVRDSTGRELLRQSATISVMSDTKEGEDQMALVEAAIPFREDMAQIDLVLDGAVLAKYSNSQNTPPAVRGVKVTQQPGTRGRTITWDASPASAGKVTFTVQVLDNTKKWMTIAIGLTEPTMMLSPEQAQLSVVRIIASNGFRSSNPVVIRMPSTRPGSKGPAQRPN
jgi:hypothetical protein